MNRYFAKSEEWENAIREMANAIAPEYMNIANWSVDQLLFNILLNDELTDVTASEWDKCFRKEYGLKALFCGGEIKKLSPTIYDAFELAEEVYDKLPSSFDEKVLDGCLVKKNYNFAQRGEEAHFDNAGSSLGVVIRVDVRTSLEKGTLIYWNQGYGHGKTRDRQKNLAKVYVLNFVEEFDEEQSIAKVSSIKSVDLF